ncbi:hypothetical protein H4Q26_009957 [Puccinia striiformis f. sp. tritici PST-130]|nr:hypothetical protein H4Q26_009957 [Puccinia striiformis f. sp. tritici PST-130]
MFEIGIQVLKDNGTATDAAIATALCVGVVNSFSSGIGGGGETVPNGEYYSQAFINDPTKSEKGGLSIGIPGELAGFEAAYQKFGGGVSWKRIFQPSIDLAKNFSVGTALASKLSNQDTIDWMNNRQEWRSIFLPTLHHQKGDIAKQLVDTINREGGKVSMDDFRTYKPIVDRAINTTYHEYNIWTTGPPSSGVILLHIMNILERYSLHLEPRTELSEHRFIEALKYAFSARTELGDPTFLNSTQLERINLIHSKSFGNNISAKIDDQLTYDYQHYQPKYDIVEDHGTTHLSVIDKFGSVVSLTSTVNLNFGSNVMDPDNGIILNDENDDFSIRGRSNAFDLFSSPLNYPITGKRSVSSMAPIIVDYMDPLSNRSEFFCAIGASGGSRIFSAVTATFLKLLWGYDLSHAIEDPRIHHQLLPNLLYVENSYRPDFLESLISKNHNISMIDIFYGKAAVQGIHKRVSDGWLFGSSDSRKLGAPEAY